MSWKRQLAGGLRVLMRRSAADRELNDELEHYYAEEVAALTAQGVSAAEARRRVRLKLGDPGNVVEDVRAHGWEHAMDVLTTDLRHAVRRLRRSPGFVAVAVLTLAIGIGASTAIFSTIRPILLEPVPYEEADRIVVIADRAPDGQPLDVTFGTYLEIVQRSHSFAAHATLRPWQPTLTGAGQPERLEGQRVGAEYFRVLGVRPALGRDFTAEEDRAGGANVLVLSHGLWQRRFSGRADIIGRAITLNDQPFIVVGVLPADFENVLFPPAEVWAPLQYDAALPPDGREWGHHLRMIGRLAPAVTVDGAARELTQIAATPLPEFTRVPWASLSRGLTIRSLRAEVTGGVRYALLAVAAAVVLVLAIACVNVTNLLLARGAERSGELALRAALGAGRQRLVAQLLVESQLLALLGAALGLGVARFGMRTLIALSPPDLPRVNAIEMDAGVFAFAFGTAVIIGTAVGLFVALRAARREHATVLRTRSDRVAGADHRTRRVLVVAQVALAVVLLVSAGLLLRSMQRLTGVDPGFDATRVLTMHVQASGRRFEDDLTTHRFYADVLDAVRAVPGVSSAAFTSQLPLSGDFQKFGIHLESTSPPSADEDGSGFRYAVTPDYFTTLRIPLRRGRLFDERDRAEAPAVVVINESFAARRFAGVDAIGRKLRLGGDEQPLATIVGIVGDVHQESLGVLPGNAVYLPTLQSRYADRALWIVVRGRGDAAALEESAREAIWSVDPDQPISRVATMEELVERSAAQRRFTLMIFRVFALTALLLAAIGLYGVLAGIVHARVREIGVRAALGATRIDILGLVVGQGVALTGLGLALGLAASAATTRAIRSLLFDVSALDPLTYVGVLVLMLGVCAAACCVPAARAARVHPATALRSETHRRG